MTASPPAWPWPAFIAHRGGGRFAPENTLAAMRAGAAHGFRMVEFDVKLSRDGVPFLLHDDRINRTSDGRGVASNLDWKTLSQFDFGSWHGPDFAGEPAPTLLSVARYTLARGLYSNIEIKPTTGCEVETGTAVAQAVDRLWAGAELSPLLSSFSESALEAARTAAPHLPRALLIEGPVPADWHTRMTGLGCIGLNIDTRHTDETLVREILDQGATLAIWTVDDPARARELLRWGCQAVFTNALDEIGPGTPDSHT
ncbi:MAG TPA: glycerophosphodiester phosphodiesterase [Castellaniella sp.]|nr:glycerophosphodiester phosphodiesterase [Castellaniella sp.]